jgi:hypothetical protein
LLHLVVHIIKTQFIEFDTFFTDMEPVLSAYRISVQSFVNDFNMLSKDMDMVFHSVLQDTADDILASAFGPFVRRAMKLVSSTAEKVSKVESRFRKCLLKYGEDPVETTSESLFSTIKCFCESYQRVKREMEIVKIEPARAEKVDTKSIVLADKPVKNTTDHFVLDLTDGEKKGVMDSLLDSLKRGTLPSGPQRILPRTARSRQVGEAKAATTKPTWRKVSPTVLSQQAEFLLDNLESI